MTPSEEPARAGLTNTGNSSRSCTRSTTADGLSSHSRGFTTTYGATGRPWPAKTSFMYALSIPTAEASTPAPT